MVKRMNDETSDEGRSECRGGETTAEDERLERIEKVERVEKRSRRPRESRGLPRRELPLLSTKGRKEHTLQKHSMAIKRSSSTGGKLQLGSARMTIFDE
jgi:hypothetical protein